MARFYLAVFLLMYCGILQASKSKVRGFDTSCTTDYISTLNCSCSGLDKTLSCEIWANCSDEEGWTDGRCIIRPPKHWCIIQLKDFFMIANPDTTCTLKGKDLNPHSNLQESNPNVLHLDQMIKPRQPVNLTLTDRHKEFNISWDMDYNEDQNIDLFNYLKYQVRLRPKDDMEETDWKLYNVREDRRYQEIHCEQLSPGRVYLVDVQASVNSRFRKLEGETWSEWSENVACTCPPPDSHNGFSGPFDPVWCLVVLFVLVPFGLFKLFRMCFAGLHKKSCLFQYIPDPNNFFKPLYHTYQGDFKKWVGPVFTFSSFDVLEKSAPLQLLNEKPQTAAPLQKPLLHHQGSGGGSLGDWNLSRWITSDLSKRYFLGSSSLGLSNSGGHISMDTVTVSGQENAVSGNTDRNAVQISDESEDLELGRSNGSEDQEFHDWPVRAHDAEIVEELSLDSFNSDENSDYGYPQISLDLDTIDSGFLESDCSSPVSTECEGGDRMDAGLLDGTVGTNSNYIKQWVAFAPAPGENSDSL